MKTIIRLSPHVVDSPERITAEKLPMLAVRMLAESYGSRAGDPDEDALLVLDQDKNGRPVYITIGSRPPELAIGGRRVFAVFSPPESQEPIATFFERSAADAWAALRWPTDPADPGMVSNEYAIGEIDATDKPVVRVAVSALIQHDGKVLLGRLKKSGVYVLPDGLLEVGESIESAVQRAVKVTTGLDVGKILVSMHAPYVSTFIEKAGQHFLSLVMIAEYVGGDPQAIDPMWESVGWHDSEKLPEPRSIVIKQIEALGKYNAPAPTIKRAPRIKKLVKKRAR